MIVAAACVTLFLVLMPLVWLVWLRPSDRRVLMVLLSIVVMAIGAYGYLVWPFWKLELLDRQYQQFQPQTATEQQLDQLLMSSRELLRQCSRLGSLCLRVRSLMADTMSHSGRYAQANQQYDYLLAQSQIQDPDLFYRYARSLYLEARTPQLAINPAPTVPDAQLEQAERLAAEALSQKPQQVGILLLLADIAEARSDDKGALGYLTEALSLVQAQPSTAVSDSRLDWILLDRIGQLKKRRAPRAQNYQLQVQFEIADSCLKGITDFEPSRVQVLMEAFLEQVAGLPLARAAYTLKRASTSANKLEQFTLTDAQFLIAGFDLATAYSRQDAVRIEISLFSGEVDIDASKPTGNVVCSAQKLFPELPPSRSAVLLQVQ